DRAHGGFGARADEPNHFDRGDHPCHALGEANLAFRRRAVGGSAADRPRQRPVDEGRLVPEEVRPVGHDVVEVRAPVRVPHARALARRHEEGLAADGRKGAHGRGHAARHELLRAPVESRGTRGLRRLPQPSALLSHRAASLAWYVRMKAGPARTIPVRISSVIRRSSIQPFWAAALTMAYSPETLYAPIGASKRARASRMTSR